MPSSRNIFPEIVPSVPGAVLLEVYIYGETLTNPKAGNYRGQVYQTYDGSGKQQVKGYDFKSNPLSTQLQLLADRELTDADWSTLNDTALSSEVFTTSTVFDALNRPVNSTDPGSNVQAFTYDKGGLLKTVALNGNSYVNDIHYDAKGQRQAIWYGNGTKTSYTYDEFTFRLRRLLTVNLSTNAQLQDLNYYYDPVGNITTIRDDAQQTLFFNNSVVSPTQTFTYDALYRLIAATGRELKGTASFGNEDNWNDAPWMGQLQPSNGSAVQNYTQHYTYDAVGNILSLQHIAGTGSYTRTYDVDTASNKLLNTTVGSNTYHYTHDVRGNMLTMPHLKAMGWNALNELYTITQGTTVANYQYSAGQRIRKYVDKGTIKEERIYLGSYEIYRKFDQASSLIIERTTVHISDDTGRIAMLEVRTQGTDPSPAELTRYIYSNHLQSASLELDESAEIISYEEYHPYGTTSYQAMNASIKAVAKRYRYTGKERDEESGLYYHGARYYIPWLCRWTAVDPLESKYAGKSPYNYGFNNPVKWTDSTGMGPDDPQKYKVQKGDTLSKIAKGHDTTVEKLVQLNHISNPDKIQVGENLILPNSKEESKTDSKYTLSDFLKFKIHQFEHISIKFPANQIGFVKPEKELFDLAKIESRSDKSGTHKGLFTEEDAVKGLHYIYIHYGREMAEIIEKMYRNETNHFRSQQFIHTGTGGMEVGSNNTAPAPYYGWPKSFFMKFPQYTPVGTWSAYEGKGSGSVSQVKNRKKIFVVMPSVEAGMVFKAEYILRHGGNWARWNTTDPKGQEIYRKAIKPIRTKIVDTFK